MPAAWGPTGGPGLLGPGPPVPPSLCPAAYRPTQYQQVLAQYQQPPVPSQQAYNTMLEPLHG
jgi:hypothetical protein